MIYGRNPVKEALRGPYRVLEVHFQKGLDKEGRKLVDTIRKMKVPYSQKEKHDLGNLAGSREHQGFVAEVEELKNSSLNRLYFERSKGLRVLMVTQVQDPGNLGAVVRNCEHMGVDLLILGSKGSCSNQLGSVAKASAGAVEHQAILISANLPKVISELKEKEFRVYGLVGESGEDIFDLALIDEENVCFVIGSEGFGIKQNIEDSLDALVHIPRRGKVNSLNLSSASMVALSVLTT